MFLERLAVCGTVAAFRAHGRSYDDWHRDLMVVHVRKLGGVIDDLVGGERQEVAEHDLTDRAEALKGQSVTQAEDRRCTDGRVADPAGELLAQVLRDLEGAAIRPFDVLSNKNDSRVARHVG